MPILTGIDTTVEATMGGSSLAPVGDNIIRIVKTEDGMTHDNHGKQITVYFKTDGGQEVRHWITYSVDPAYPDDQWKAKTGLGQLALIAECCGKTLDDVSRRGTEILHGVPFVGTIQHVDSKTMKDDGTPFKNAKFTSFKKQGASSDTPPPPNSAPQGW